MSKYYALKVEEEIVFIIPWDKQQDPFLSDFQFAIAKVWGKFGSDFHKGMLHVQDVPGFEYILIHTGNTDENTMGCLLVADTSQQNITKDGFIGASVDAYKRIYPSLAQWLVDGNKLSITYIDYDNPRN